MDPRLRGDGRASGNQRQNGFTLIEILIVMVIITIVAGVAVVTISSNQRKQYETLANQISRAITLAEQEAMLRPATIGFGISDQHYQFFIFKRDLKTHKSFWQPIQQTALGQHSLPNNTQITLRMSGKEILTDGKPQIIVTPSGDLSPFILLIGRLDEKPYYRITGKANSEVFSAPIQATE